MAARRWVCHGCSRNTVPGLACRGTEHAQVFKICLDYWNFFVPDVYASVTTGLADGSASFAFVGALPPPGAAAAGRKHLYREVLSRLRLLMITRMAKPEEVRGNAKQRLLCSDRLGCAAVGARVWLPARVMRCAAQLLMVVCMADGGCARIHCT